MKEFIEDIKQMDKNQLILLAAQLKKDLLLTQKTQPIAVVGMAARFPGQRDFSLDSFWNMIIDGKNCVTDITNKRWSHEQFFSDDFDAPGKTYVDKMALLEQFDTFDAEFFNIHPGEAELMDPQQRWLLETCWHAFEDAGIDPLSVKGKNGGVFVGLMNHDYVHLQNLKRRLSTINGYSALGSAMSVASGRISYFYGLTGPSYAIDTACSSSLVSIHEACQALRNKECEFALAGGVNAILSPTTTIAESKARMLSPSGACHTYDQLADGYVRGEGCGMIVLKRLSDAKRDGDRIYGVIRGSAINQDGASQGLTAPNGPSQVKVIKAAAAAAQISAEQVGFVETHGTGTPLGDPIEIQSLCEAYQTDSRPVPLHVSSLKTNIGHTESAAGVAGVIKLMLAIYHQTIPKHNQYQNLNEHIDLSDQNLEIVAQNKPWPKESPFGAVSSFGFSGTNAHLIAGPAPQIEAQSANDESTQDSTNIIVFSAKSAQSAEKLANAWQTQLTTQPHLTEKQIAQLAFAARHSRAQFSYRGALIYAPANGWQLESIAKSSPTKKTAWLFTGQGSQYKQMGKALYQQSKIFQQALDTAIADYDEMQLAPQSLRDVIFSDSSSLIDNTQFTQPSLLALQLALSAHWQSYGLKPHLVIGHSVGEYAAAVLAGVMSAKDAMTMLGWRGYLMTQLCKEVGGMVAVNASSESVNEILRDFPELTIAANNGPKAVVVSGKIESVNDLTLQLKAQNIRCKLLTVSHAFHSPLMQPMLAEFSKKISSIKLQKPSIELLCTQTTTQTVEQVRYWVEHVSATVDFYPAIEQALKKGVNTWLEVGPSNTLLGLTRQICVDDASEHHWIACLDPSIEADLTAQKALARLYIAGCEIVWPDSHHARSTITTSVLPLYPFQNKRYWFESNSLFSLNQTEQESTLQTNSQTEDELRQDIQNQFIEQISNLDIEQQWLFLVGLTRRAIAEVLNQEEDEIPVDIDLFDLGLDSMKAMDMRAKVQQQMGFQLSATLLFDYPNVLKLVDYFGIELLGIWKESPVADELMEND